MPGKSHGPRSLGSYSPWGHKESDMTERLQQQHKCRWGGYISLKYLSFEKCMSTDILLINEAQLIGGHMLYIQKNHTMNLLIGFLIFLCASLGRRVILREYLYLQNPWVLSFSYSQRNYMYTNKDQKWTFLKHKWALTLDWNGVNTEVSEGSRNQRTSLSFVFLHIQWTWVFFLNNTVK